MNVNDSIRIDVPASHRYLSVPEACISEVLARVGGVVESDSMSYNVKLALHEICVNIVDHAYSDCENGRIEIVLALSRDCAQLCIDVHDTGTSFDESQVLEPSLTEPQIHGYGIFLARRLLDEVTYTPGPNSNSWHLVKRLRERHSV